MWRVTLYAQKDYLCIHFDKLMVSEQLTSDLLTHKFIQFMAHIACYVRQPFA